MAKYYNVTGNGCKKWIQKYGIYDEVKKNFKKDYSVCQYSLDGSLIKTWGSASEIERELGIKKCNIQRVCNGIKQTSNGFIWKYEKNV